MADFPRVGDLAERDSEPDFHLGGEAESQGAELRGGGAKRIRGLLRMTTLNATSAAATASTGDHVLGNIRLDDGHLDDLMPARLLGLAPELVAAARARVGFVDDSSCDLFRWKQLTKVCFVSKLTARLAPRGDLLRFLGDIQRVRRGGTRGVAGILAQPLFQLGDSVQGRLQGGLKISDPGVAGPMVAGSTHKGTFLMPCLWDGRELD